MPTVETPVQERSDLPAVQEQVAVPAVQEPAAVPVVQERPHVAELWLDLAKQSERTGLETARRFVETVERVPLLGPAVVGVDRLMRAEFALARLAVHGPTDVDVNVNVDVLSRGMRIGDFKIDVF